MELMICVNLTSFFSTFGYRMYVKAGLRRTISFQKTPDVLLPAKGIHSVDAS
jgi:hypothetical protein